MSPSRKRYSREFKIELVRLQMGIDTVPQVL